MNLLAKFNVAVLASSVLVGCNSNDNTDRTDPIIQDDVQIAFMPDIHFHDVYGDFTEGSFEGLTNSISGKNATIRTMESQMNSTRLFNENYFSMMAALDDVVARGIKYVALPGDFSDDGQPVHMKGLVAIFDQYSKDHGLEFFAAPGNHDPNRPFSVPAGKADYLGGEGREQRIYSEGAGGCSENGSNLADGTICTADVQHWGYQEIMGILSQHGFEPNKDTVYFETPYSSDAARQDYSYDVALKEAAFENRHYEICHEGTGGEYKEESYTSCSSVPDSSYLIEPVEGIWLLAIDANVYKPKAGSVGGEGNGNDYDGSSNAGYNMMLTHKANVIDWISDVATQAKAQGKTLISFSHFPMTDFYSGASAEIVDFFDDQSQLRREPSDATSKALAKTGLSVHVGGHMHYNDTGIKKYMIDGEEHTLFNIQAPSLAGYIPAYKILTVKDHSQIEVETVIIEDVERFDELFEHYEAEHQHLVDSGEENIWNKEILDSQNYGQLAEWHIKELTRLRLIPNEWPENLANMLVMDGKMMLILSQLDTDVQLCQLQEIIGTGTCTDAITQSSFVDDWREARYKAAAIAADVGLSLTDFADWNGQDLATDFYRLRNSDELAFRDISEERMQQYQLIGQQLSQFDQNIVHDVILGDNDVGAVFKESFATLFSIIDKFLNGEASDHFMIDTEAGSITNMKADHWLKRVE